MAGKKNILGLTLVELCVAIGAGALLMAFLIPAISKMYLASSTAVSAHILRQLSVAGNLYLADNDGVFWKYAASASGGGIQYWFGLDREGTSVAEGQRILDMTSGPLGPYIAKSGGIRPDPSFLLAGKTFKPKFQNGHFAFGYNTLMQDRRVSSLASPSQTIVFATSAQVNTFQSPASIRNPMLEEFYMINDVEYTVHFRHGGKAMVAFASGAVDFLPMDETTRDTRLPAANVGRFAPYKNKRYLQ